MLKAFLIYALATGAAIVSADGEPTKTHAFPFATLNPTQIANFKADMRELGSKVKNDPMFTSLKELMKTAIPEAFINEIKADPKAAHEKYKATPPDWVKAIPQNVKDFVSANKEAAKSIWTKDIGPLPTGFGKKGSGGISQGGDSKGGVPGTDDQQKKSTTNEAGELRVVSAAVVALMGALGVAALLL